jgi:hypothetical protein
MKMKPDLNGYAVRYLFLVAILFFLTSTGCRKTDTVYKRVIPDQVSEVVIPGTLPDILHPHEKNTGKDLSAHKHFLIGTGLYHGRLSGNPGMVGDPVTEIAELGLDIYFESKGEAQQAKTEAELENINNQLASLSSELESLEAGIEALAAQISLDFTKLENFELALQAQTQFNYISDLYSSTSVNSLLYFSQAALDIKKGQPGVLSWGALATFWTEFEINANNNTSGAAASVTALHGLVRPNSATLQDGLLSKFAEQVITQSNGGAQQPGNAAAALGLLENYFTTIINYQFQALAVYGNVVNTIDTTGYTFRAYLNGTFRQQIVDEISMYLNTVDFMVLNLADFRSQSRFEADMQYYQLAMAPDTSYLNGLARSRFIAALLYQSVDLSYPVINGTIVTPHDLTKGNETPVSSISCSIDGIPMPSTTGASVYKSIYPYTKWSDSLAMADNQWNVYNILDSANTYTGGNHVLQINSIDAYHPWRHELPIQGIVRVMYYNPAKPDPATATTTPTASNTMAFGFTSWAWYWGFMRLSAYDFTERSYLPFLFNFHMNPPLLLIQNNTYGFSWTDPGQETAFPPLGPPNALPPAYSPPPFTNNITYKGNVQHSPGFENQLNITVAYGISYWLAAPPSGGSSVNMLYFSDVYAYQKQMGFPVNFEVYSQRFDQNNVNNQWTVLFDYNNRPEFFNGFRTTTMTPVTLATNYQYREFNFLEAYNLNTPANWEPEVMDFEYRWCTQYCYSFTYPASEIFGQ